MAILSPAFFSIGTSSQPSQAQVRHSDFSTWGVPPDDRCRRRELHYASGSRQADMGASHRSRPVAFTWYRIYVISRQDEFPYCYSLPQSPITGQTHRKSWATGERTRAKNQSGSGRDSRTESCAHVYKLTSIAAASILTTDISGQLALLSVHLDHTLPLCAVV